MAKTRGAPWDDVRDQVTGKCRILSDRCTTCVFRPGNLMHLGPGQLAALIKAARDKNTYVVCHETLEDGPNPEMGQAVCRGFADRYDTLALTIMSVTEDLIEVDPPA